MNLSKYKIAKLIINILVNFLTILEYTSAQNIQAEEKKSIFVTYGNIILSSQVSFSYERMIYKKDNRQTRVKVNYGNYLSNNADYATNATVFEHFTSISAVQLLGFFGI